MNTAPKKQSEINLLPKEEFLSSTFGRVFTWLLSTFRVIVILTEVVVMGVFLSRFWLDVRANDLNDLIRKNQAILGTTTEFENTYRDIQKKLTTFSQINSTKISSTDTLNKITKNLPKDVTLNSVQTSKNSVQIKGSSISEIAISQFMVNLKSVSTFTNVVLLGTNINQQDGSLTEFNLKIEVASKGEK
jgi:Tfp pilus assembly protein PilN